MSKTTFVTYNFKNIKRSVEGIRQICDFPDVIALHETWLLPCEVPFHFTYGGTLATDWSAGVLPGRPYGGEALLWLKTLLV